jgi:hypothetical protein
MRRTILGATLALLIAGCGLDNGPTTPEELGSGAVNGKLYAIGGYVDGDIAANEVYTPGDVWVPKRDMPTAREAFAAAVVSGKLYALGGLKNGTAIATGHQMLAPKGGYGDACSDTPLEVTPDEALFVGILPDRQAGTGGPPCGHDLGIGLRSGPDPFEEEQPAQKLGSVIRTMDGNRFVVGSAVPGSRMAALA